MSSDSQFTVAQHALRLISPQLGAALQILARPTEFSAILVNTLLHLDDVANQICCGNGNTKSRPCTSIVELNLFQN